MSNTPADLEEFFDADTYVLYGESAKRKTFAATIRTELEKNGRQVIAARNIAPFAGELSTQSKQCNKAIVALNKKNARTILNDLKSRGISMAFMQFGSYDKNLLELYEKAGIKTLTGCAIMYLPNSGGVHRFHRWLHSLFFGSK